MFKGGVGGRVRTKYLMLILSSISDKGRGARGQQVQIHFDLPDVDFVLFGKVDRPLYEGSEVKLQGCDAFCTL